MNKLILIGNGFDLAHGLPTSYCDFINDFWENIHINYKKDEYKEIVFINEDYYLDIFIWLEKTNDYESLKANLKKCAELLNHNYDRDVIYSKIGNSNSNTIFKFKNAFFLKINKLNSLQNWVDIENEYYKSLKEIAKSNSLEIQEKKKRVNKLNKEFEQVKNILEKYLIEKVYDKYDLYNLTGDGFELRDDYHKFESILKPISLLSDNDNLVDEFSNLEDKKEIEQFLEKEKKEEKHTPKIHFLIFNYITTIWRYQHIKNTDNLNYIHGFINDKEHPINFGFGDEMDEDYKQIENLDENEFLEYFKSFKYANTRNYNNLLNFINSQNFQVVIMGHSCGLSDRLLLNTIFEHDYCRSIKVYYHEKYNGIEKIDNYTNIIQNISRHFKDKQKMREKIVNKKFCEPLPQLQIPFKKPKNNEI